MIGVEIASEINIPSSEVMEAHRKRMKDAGDRGFAESDHRVPEDRGTLRQSLFPPEWRGKTLIWGSADVAYAEPMEKGTGPFFPPLEPLQEWAERIGKDRGFGWWVARVKIPEEGIQAQPYLEPGAEEARRYLRSHGLDL